MGEGVSMTSKEAVQIAVIAEQVKQIHEVLTGDEGVCKRLKNVESDVSRAKGAAWVIGGVAGFIGTLIGHWWGKK
jgi:hypothetical protein